MSSASRLRRQRGYHAENMLRKMLERVNGNVVFRVPVSGARGNYPDVFVVNNLRRSITAFQVKSTTKNMVKIPRQQLYAMKRFLNAFKLYPHRVMVCAVYFQKDKKWVFTQLGSDKYLSDLIVRNVDESNWSMG